MLSRKAMLQSQSSSQNNSLRVSGINLIHTNQTLIPQDFSLDELKAPVLTGETRSENWRKSQLKKVETIIEIYQAEIINALQEDLGKPPTEAFFEILALKQELKVIQKGLKNWMRPKKIDVPLYLQPGTAKVTSEPLGCVLIIGAWNYPFMLTIQPLISALAAGNTAVLKPSEFSPSTSQIIDKLFTKFFPKTIVHVLQGDAQLSQELVTQNFDHIFFTGGSRIGSKVMESAAQNLTPVTLELGGRNPAIVMPGADIEITAKRLIWGKGINAGQTCLAPNHLYIEESLLEPLVNAMKKQITTFYGQNPLKSPHLGKINSRQFPRVKAILEDATKRQCTIFGGKISENHEKISPTLILLSCINDPLLNEELFGPILPILTFSNFQSVLSEIRSQEKPLALYLFGGDKKEQQMLLDSTSSGGVCFNDVIMHAGIPQLPFGGVGASGIGRYHGKSGFDNFSHKKSIFSKPFWIDIQFRYPPYKVDIDVIKKLFR